ncbi:MAG: hypothetical protein ACFFEY_06860 [Candidatus Thorarchaeota archaeon]
MHKVYIQFEIIDIEHESNKSTPNKKTSKMLNCQEINSSQNNMEGAKYE